MTFEELKSAMLNMSERDQKRFVTEVVPAIWPKICADDACVARFRELVDEATIKKYREEHLGNI